MERRNQSEERLAIEKILAFELRVEQLLAENAKLGGALRAKRESLQNNSNVMLQQLEEKDKVIVELTAKLR